MSANTDSNNSTILEGILSIRDQFAKFTPMIIFLTIYMALNSFNFGFDVGTFSGVQGMQSFAKRFGEWDSEADMYALPSYLSSTMTSVPFLGKLLGVIACGPVAERWGRKRAILVIAILALVGCTLQTSAHSAAQFTIGRVINFATTGFCIVVVPIYQAECAPKELRGLIGSTLQLTISLGGLVAALVNYGTQDIPSDAAWLIPTGLQLVMPLFILLLLPLTPESPRWLLSKDRVEQAYESLRRLRGSGASEGSLRSEIEEFRASSTNLGKGTWVEVFNNNNRHRTGIAMLAMIGQQITGQAFMSQYGIIFYQRNGFADRAFELNIISNVIGVVAIMLTWVIVDSVGRRPILMTGGSLMGTSLMIVGAMASISNPTQAGQNAMVGFLMLFNFMYALSWGPIPYIVLGECASSRVKEKASLLACCASVFTTFVTSFTLPYLLNPPYAALGGKVGYIYGGICLLWVAFAIFCVPELKGRSLEDVDWLFSSGVPVWRFKGVKVGINGHEEEGPKEVYGGSKHVEQRCSNEQDSVGR